MSRLRWIALGLAMLTCNACISYAPPETFSYHFPDNDEKATKQVIKRLPEPSVPSEPDNALGKPIAVGTTLEDEPRKVVAFDVESGDKLWERELDAITRPEVQGDVVVTSDHDALVALDLRSGDELWRVPTEDFAYVGADREGNVLVYVLSVGASGGANRKGLVVAVDARSGDELWEHLVDKAILGKPALQGGLAFVPWNRQNIAIIDVAKGVETARLRSTDDVLNWVRATDAGVHYGGRGMYRLTETSYKGTKQGTAYRPPPIPEAPGEPLVHEDGFLPTPGTRSARGRIRIYYGPAPAQGADGVPVLGDRFYFVYYRYVFAFDPQGELQWVRMLDQDVLDAQVLEQGLLAMGHEGAAHLLDAGTGNDRWTGKLDAELASMSVDAAGFAPGGEAGERKDLRTALNEMALDPDNRLASARAFAIEKLAGLEDPEITRDLLDLYAQRSMPGVLRDAIAKALRARERGSEHLVEALDQHYDHLEGTRSPPLEVIVPSILQMESEKALPKLIAQMRDPATPAKALPLVIGAIVELGGEDAVAPLREFLVLYRADSTFEKNPEPLVAAAQGIFQHGGPEGRELLQELMAESETRDALAQRIDGLFEQEQKQAEKRAQAQADAAARAAAEAARKEREARPEKLSQEHINQAFAQHADALRECVAAEMARNPRLGQVRMVFILENEGTARELRVAPNSPDLQRCLEPKVRSIDFPAFRQSRQRASFTIAVRDGGPARAEQPTTGGPWWARAARRAGDVSGPFGKPWWKGTQGGAAQPQPQPEQPEGPGQPAAADAPWWMEGAPKRPEPPGGPEPEQPQAPEQPEEAEARGEDEEPTEGEDEGEPPDDEGEDGTPWWLPTQQE